MLKIIWFVTSYWDVLKLGRYPGDTLTFSYMRRLVPFFWGNFNNFWCFQKNEYLFGYEILWIFFGGHPKIGLILGVISMYFMVFP